MKETLRAKKTVVQDMNGHKQTLIPFENYIPVEEIIDFRLRDRKVGAYFCRKNNDLFRFVFGFETVGVHSNLTYDEMEPFFDALSDGLKDLPKGESLKIYFNSFTSDADRQKELTEVALRSPKPLQYVFLAEKQRTAELNREGIRKPKKLYLFVTATFAKGEAQASDWIERLLVKAQNVIEKVSETELESKYLKYTEMFESAFNDGFLRWEQLLNVKMKLPVKALEAFDLWKILYERFNDDEPPPLPQVLVYDVNGIHSHTTSELHLTTLALKQQSSVPIADRRYVYIPAKKKYIAPVILCDKPAGWKDKQHQLCYIWDIFARDQIFDTEFVCEISRANEAMIKENISRVVRQSYSAQLYSQRHQQLDVSAAFKQRKAIEAQEALLSGEIPLNIGVAFFVHRSSVSALESGVRYLQNCIPRPAWLDWEQEYAWQVWLQSLPFAVDKFLVQPFYRQMVFSNEEVPAFMSVVRPSPIDKVGIEFITDQGGVPIHLDLFHQHRNIAFFATTRSGKSVTISHVIIRALAEGIPVILMDFPPSDEASTFKDLTYYVGGAYFDIGSEASNLMEPPDLRQFPEEKREERFLEFLDFVCSALLIMCYGSGAPSNSSDKLLRQSIRSVLTPAVADFYNDFEISNRFDRAIASGFGTPEWEQMPTLVDFIEWFDNKGVPAIREKLGGDPSTETAINQIKRQIRFWLSSRVGQSISRPSTFRSDSQLLVFALRGLGDSDDAALLALSAYSAAIRRTLSYPKSIFFIDEFSVLLEWSEIANLVARFTANGAKAGIRVILAAQDPNTLANNAAGPKIIQNLSTVLIGRIKPNAIDSFVNILKIDREIISRNASEAFYPSKEGLYSQWLMEDQNKRVFVRYYSPPYLLAVVANNPHESICRRAWIKKLGMYKGILEFSKEIVQSLREGIPLKGPDLSEEEMAQIRAEEEEERKKYSQSNADQVSKQPQVVPVASSSDMEPNPAEQRPAFSTTPSQEQEPSKLKSKVHENLKPQEMSKGQSDFWLLKFLKFTLIFALDLFKILFAIIKGVFSFVFSRKKEGIKGGEAKDKSTETKNGYHGGEITEFDELISSTQSKASASSNQHVGTLAETEINV